MPGEILHSQLYVRLYHHKDGLSVDVQNPAFVTEIPWNAALSLITEIRMLIYVNVFRGLFEYIYIIIITDLLRSGFH